jgi:hypothetical protein
MADDFLTTYAPLANDIADHTGLNPATVLGIIDTETGHGQHVLGSNIFGISPGGRVASYPDVQTASQAFVSLMKTPRYAGVSTTTDPAVQAAMLVKGGYNTVNPNYAQTVAANAQNAVKQLGYQGGQGQGGDSSQPAPDYNNPPPSQSQTPAPTSSAKEQLKQELGGGGTSTTTSPSSDAPPTSAKEQLKQELSDGKDGDFTGPPAKTPAPDVPLVDDYGRPIPTAPLQLSPPAEAAKNALFLPDTITPEQRKQIAATTPLERIIGAARQGATETPDASSWAPGGLQLGRFIVNPLLEIGGAGLRGGLQFLGEAAGGDPKLTRDIQALPEAFPTGVDMPMVPPSALAARNALARRTPFSRQRPISVQEITDAIRRSDRNALQPEQAGVSGDFEITDPTTGRPLGGGSFGGASPQPEPPPTDTTGLTAAVGGMGSAISDSLRDHLWSQLQKGDLTEAGAPSTILQAAKAQVDSGAIKTRADFDQFYQNYGDQLRAQRTGQQPAPQPQPSGGAAASPQPTAAGAAATTEPIPEQTRVQRATNIQKDVEQTAADRAGPGLRDDTAYVEDIPPRIEAHREFSTQSAIDHETSMRDDPAYKAHADAIDAERNSGMTDRLKAEMGDGNTLTQLRDERALSSPDDMGVFTQQKPVDAGKAEALRRDIEALRDGPEGKTKASKAIFNDILDSLHDADGNLETMPSFIYGGRKNVTNWLDKKAGDASDAVRAVRKHLTDLIPKFDEVINSGAPKFEEWRQVWHELSKPIDRQEFLQQYRAGQPKSLWDGNGKLQFRPVQKLLADIQEGHLKSVHKAQSLTDDQIQTIVNVRNELATKKFTREQALEPGSPTAQMRSSMAKRGAGPLGVAARVVGGMAAHGAGVYAAEHGIPGVNAVIGMYQTANPLRQAMRAAKQEAATQAEIAAMKQRLLSQGGPANPLQP